MASGPTITCRTFLTWRTTGSTHPLALLALAEPGQVLIGVREGISGYDQFREALLETLESLSHRHRCLTACQAH